MKLMKVCVCSGYAKKLQGCFRVCCKIDCIIAFSEFFMVKNLLNLLSIIKKNQDSYQSYCIVNKLLSDLWDIQSSTDNLTNSVGVERRRPRKTRFKPLSFECSRKGL